MKTQLITLLLIVSSIFSINSFANSNDLLSEKPSPIATNVLANDFIGQAETLSVEDWMHNDTYWKHANEMTFHVEIEKELQVEEWMTNSSHWEVKNVTNRNVSTIENTNETIHIYRLKSEKENELCVETWMIDDHYWNL